MTVRVPASAPLVPPLTGASTNPTPSGCQPAGDPAAGRGITGRAVHQQRAGSQPGEQAIGPVEQRLHLGRRGKAGDDDRRTLCRLARRGRRAGPDPGGERRGARARAVPDRQGKARGDSRRHRLADGSEPEERDPGHRKLPNESARISVILHPSFSSSSPPDLRWPSSRSSSSSAGRSSPTILSCSTISSAVFSSSTCSFTNQSRNTRAG